MWISFGSDVAIALVDLGSSVTLNAIASLTIFSLLSSYILSIGCFLSKRLRREPLPAARFSLGRWGMAINIIAIYHRNLLLRLLLLSNGGITLFATG